MIDQSLRNSNILIVDDQQSNIDVLIGLLEIKGYFNIKSTTDSRRALSVFNEFKPDIVLLDLMMPHYNGHEIMQQIKNALPPDKFVPILVLTADISIEAKQRALSNGASDFLTKPFDLTEVGLRIQNLLKTNYLHQQIENLNLSLEEKVKERTHILEKTNEELIIAKQKAEASDKLKSSFLQNLSHEVRTPMNGILGFIQLMKDEDTSSADKIEFLDIIEKSSYRLMNIVIDLVDISMIETGNIEVSMEIFSVNERIREMYTFFGEEARTKGLAFTIGPLLSLEESRICSDSAKIGKIISNLVRNAIKFTSKGSIEVGYSLKEHDFEFYVKDTGIGVKPEVADFIYERFRQGDERISKGYEGAGLGLSISKAFVEKLGGRIWHVPNNPMGSIFYFSIPRNLKPEDTKNNLSFNLLKEVRRRKLKVLIVEDDPYSSEYLNLLLTDKSHSVFTVSNGMDAIKTMETNPDINLVLMDIKMPDMNGNLTTQKIREINKAVVIIAQTAYNSNLDKQYAIEAGCNAFIAKPIHKEELLHLIDQQFLPTV